MQTKEEVTAERDKLAVQYEGGLPDYLRDYFDNKLNTLRVSDEIVTRKRAIYASSKEEKIEFLKNRNEKFVKKY